MKAKEICSKFVQYFKKNGHHHLPSSSLIPYQDPTLLFTNAGMNQFKDYFTGKTHPQNPTAVTVQKCVRAGGKHNDLENVGFTARHHTFFEMLGNFSFGDYFKEEAISLAWNLLTQEYGLPAEKLYVSVHHQDAEAKKIWQKQIGVPEKRILLRGDEENFWEMGEIGPCGPCSEIYYDHGESYSSSEVKMDPHFPCLLDDENRFVEIWNLVFMQYEKTNQGETRITLPSPSIDTGAGLERLTAVLQGKYWNYETDLFTPLINKIKNFCPTDSNSGHENLKKSLYVIADHIRSSTLLIADGCIPSHEGRGYVLRRIIRRAIRHLKKLDIKDVCFYKLAPTVFDCVGGDYLDNQKNLQQIQKTLEQEEKKFLETLDQGLRFLEDNLSKNPNMKTFPGHLAFKLYDTFGFPLDLTTTILQERKLGLDQEGFTQEMEKQKAQSRKSWKGTSFEQSYQDFFQYHEKHGPTQFLGYESLSTSEAQLLAIHPINEELVALIFDQTPFYGESGGQVGDTGIVTLTLTTDKNENEKKVMATITDTKKPIPEIIAHITTKSEAQNLTINKKYRLCVDQERREKIKKNHTATHILQAALLKIVGSHIRQAGSYVDEEKLRFDFTHQEKLTSKQIDDINHFVQNIVFQSLSVEAKIMNKEEAIQKGALAFFGDKYGDEVRVLQIGDISTELCGGTHINNTSEIGIFLVTQETSLSSGIRRIEAITGTKAYAQFVTQNKLQQNLEQQTHSKGDDVLKYVEGLQKETKKLKKDIEKLKYSKSNTQVNTQDKQAEPLSNDFEFLDLEVSQGSDLRKVSDEFILKYPNRFLLLYSKQKEKLSFLLRINKKHKQIILKEVLDDALPLIGGRGGGRPDMIQGSGHYDLAHLKQFKEKIKENLKDKIASYS